MHRRFSVNVDSQYFYHFCYVNCSCVYRGFWIENNFCFPLCILCYINIWLKDFPLNVMLSQWALVNWGLALWILCILLINQVAVFCPKVLLIIACDRSALGQGLKWWCGCVGADLYPASLFVGLLGCVGLVFYSPLGLVCREEQSRARVHHKLSLLLPGHGHFLT